jgi:hypothetical protein
MEALPNRKNAIQRMANLREFAKAIIRNSQNTAFQPTSNDAPDFPCYEQEWDFDVDQFEWEALQFDEPEKPRSGSDSVDP